MDAFDNYVKKRLEERRKPAKVLAELKRNYYQERVLEVLSVLKPKGSFKIEVTNEENFEKILQDNGVRIVTVRTAFNTDSKLLKPVATFPEKRLFLAENIEFQRTPQTFKDYKEALEGTDKHFPIEAPDSFNNGEAIHFSAVYTSQGDTKPRKNKISRFDYRIDAALSMMKQKLEDEFSDESVCFFSVKAKCIDENNYRGRKPKPEFRIAQIIAIYFDKSTQISNEIIIDAHKLCKSLFEESKQIRNIDNELFKLEGHELTSGLQTLFLDKNIAPSDKIAFAIERLKKLLNRHLDSHYPSTQGNETEVYFISLAYEILDKDKPKELFPILQIYPHVYRKKFPYGAFIIGHPKFVSVTKYLLRNYFKFHKEQGFNKFVVGSNTFDSSPDVSISNIFMKDIFKDIDSIIERKECKEELTPLPDQIFLSKHNDTDEIWNKLNVDISIGTEISQNEENNSILAYIVEGHEINQHQEIIATDTYQQLPRAILAIEGNQREFLSDQERTSLRVVARAFSNLVRHLFHDNTLLDYRIQLSRAYNNYSDAMTGGDDKKVTANRFIFSSMSVDVSLLDNIMKSIKKDKRISKQVANEMGEVFDKVFKKTEIEDEIVNNAEIVRDRINQRFEKATNFIRRSNEAPSQDIVDLIEACPRNFAWAGYAPSLAQALGDRVNHSPPEFELMAPGFSATGLYMALVESEIRQVAKLSSVAKLKKERNNYKKYVRYKVFVAARSPNNAFAFDSTGQCGKDCGNKRDQFEAGLDYDKKCYGVLVSDLASAHNLEIKNLNGKESPKNEQVDTFLKLITRLVAHPEKKSTNSIIVSIKGLFGKNLGYWYRTPKESDIGKMTTLDILHKCYRLNYEDKLKDEASTQTKPRNTEAWILLAFTRMLEGSKDQIISHEKRRFPFKKHSLTPENIAHFVNHSYNYRLDLEDARFLRPLLSIVHGDLNSRNLVWAGPIDNLMLIDFEHVGIGFWGMDQTRLATNIVVDFLSEVKIISDKLPVEIAQAIENAAEFIVNVWKKYKEAKVAEDSSKLEIYVNNFKNGPHTRDTWKNKPDWILKSIVQWIIRTTWHFNKELLNEQYFGILQACLGFSIVKEYEYSIVNVKRLKLSEKQISSVNEIITKYNNKLKDQLISLYDSNEFDCSSPQGKNELATISKYLISYWILSNIFNVIKFKTSH